MIESKCGAAEFRECSTAGVRQRCMDWSVQVESGVETLSFEARFTWIEYWK